MSDDTRAAVAARILWLALVLGALPAAAQDTAGVGVVRGAVVEGAGRPAADVAVCLEATAQCDVTGADGRNAPFSNAM